MDRTTEWLVTWRRVDWSTKTESSSRIFDDETAAMTFVERLTRPPETERYADLSRAVVDLFVRSIGVAVGAVVWRVTWNRPEKAADVRHYQSTKTARRRVGQIQKAGGEFEEIEVDGYFVTPWEDVRLHGDPDDSLPGHEHAHEAADYCHSLGLDDDTEFFFEVMAALDVGLPMPAPPS